MSEKENKVETGLEDCKNIIANNNNFDSFKSAIRYTFSRELLQSEENFINKIIDESMEEYAELKLSNQKAINSELVEALKGLHKEANDLYDFVIDRGYLDNEDLTDGQELLLEAFKKSIEALSKHSK